MTRRKFNSDLADASHQAASLAHISNITKGDDDGQIVFEFSHEALLSTSLVVRLVALSIDDYPNCSGFLAYTDDDATPRVISSLLDDLPDITQTKSILETLTLLSKKFSAALASEGNNSDEEMTDIDQVDDLGESQDDDQDDYYYDDDMDFGLDATPATLQQIPNASGKPIEVTGRFIDDLRRAKEAGFKIALLTDAHQMGCVFALSLPVAHLGLPDDTLEAWEIAPSDYVVLLCRFDSSYPSVETFLNLGPGHSSTMQFIFGKCTKYKPTLSSALTAFNPKFNRVNIEINESTEDAAFMQMPITNSIATFMNTELALLLKYRLHYNVSWDKAKELLQEQAKAGHLRMDEGIFAHGSTDPAIDELQVSSTARPLLNQDFVRSNPNVAGPLPKEQLSMPLIAMQFALRYFVKSTHYCLVCHRKLNTDFTAIKPYVCSEPLCLFQYMALGLGPSIEHDIIARPCVVDLLVSFCAAGLHANRIREWPQGLAIKVPLFTLDPVALLNTEVYNRPRNQAAQAAQAATPPTETTINSPIYVRASISSGRLFLDNTQEQQFKVGDIVAIVKQVTVPPNNEKLDLHHCRITSIETVRNSSDNINGRIVKFDCMVSTQKNPMVSNATRVYGAPELSDPKAAGDVGAAIVDDEGEAELYAYEHDLDDLAPVYQREALMTLVQTIPPIRVLREHLLDRKGLPLMNCDKITKSALALLRWIVASNRSFIVQLDKSDDCGMSEAEDVPSKEHEKIEGLGDHWMQFRFAQGSPEKEHSFNQALAQQASQNYPTIFAWHGSPLGNWHSIIRSGLDFKDTLHGRAYGHGVYFSNQFGISQTYGGFGNSGGSWIGSELKLSAALSLCEIINRTAEFRSSAPYYVVDKVDWIQCRYLVVQRHSSPKAPSPTAPGAKPKTAKQYITQDPRYRIKGENNSDVEVPTASLPNSRQQKTSPGSSSGNPLVVEDHEGQAADEEADDFDILLSKNAGNGDGVSADDDDNDTVILDSDPDKLGFTPGTLDVASLPRLPAPVWASDHGRKVLGKELAKLQKLQAKTPLYELGWYMDFENINNMFQWTLELHSFELSLPLAKDMERNKVSSIVLEVRFGQQFPLSPPFVRVIRPRFLPFSQRGGGHVTAGGALCMELLTNSGWSPVSSMESVLLQVRMAMCSLEPYPARLEGRSGGDYGIGEAIDAYKRAAQAHGWKVPPDLDMTANGL